MKRIGNLGFSLCDETKELSSENKIVQFHFFNLCACGKDSQLDDTMFTDNCQDGYSSFTGWEYKCTCGKVHSIWEGAFDGQIENCYENDLVVVSDDDSE